VATLIEDRLRALADDVPLPDAAVADRVVAGVTEALLTGPAKPERSSRRPLRVRLAAGAAVAVAAAAVMVVTGRLGGDGGHIDAAAAEALRRAAIRAAHQPALPPLGPGRFYHFRDTETAWIERADAPRSYTSCATACPPPPADWVVKARAVSETWIGPSRGARTLTFGRATFRSAAVRRTFRHVYGLPASRPFGVSPPEHFARGQLTFGWGLSYRQLQRLPSDPAKLKRLVYQQAAGSSKAADPGSSNTLAFEEFQVIGDLLRASPIRPDVRAALYTILSGMPGISYDGRVTDPLGRAGIEVSVAHSPGEDPAILIFDPRTAQLLSEGGGGYSDWGVVGSITP
jgi:hypothetical protein